MQFRNLPLCSSKELISALTRLGAYQGRAGKGSHVSFFRRREDGRVLVATVVQGKREVPKGTLRKILMLLEIPIEDFLSAL